MLTACFKVGEPLSTRCGHQQGLVSGSLSEGDEWPETVCMSADRNVGERVDESSCGKSSG